MQDDPTTKIADTVATGAHKRDLGRSPAKCRDCRSAIGGPLFSDTVPDGGGKRGIRMIMMYCSASRKWPLENPRERPIGFFVYQDPQPACRNDEFASHRSDYRMPGA